MTKFERKIKYAGNLQIRARRCYKQAFREWRLREPGWELRWADWMEKSRAAASLSRADLYRLNRIVRNRVDV
jgi:hypothetical protein